MWTCPKCGEKVEEDFEVCWSCGTTQDGLENPEFDPEREGIMGEPAYQAEQHALRAGTFVTVAAFGNAPEAHMVRSRLEAEGIHAVVMDELAATTWGFLTSLDNVQLQVAEKDVQRALQVLAELPHLEKNSSPEETEDAEEPQSEQEPDDKENLSAEERFFSRDKE